MKEGDDVLFFKKIEHSGIHGHGTHANVRQVYEHNIIVTYLRQKCCIVRKYVGEDNVNIMFIIDMLHLCE